MDRLDELFEKYRNNECSPTEIEELWGYFRGGQDEEHLKALIDSTLSRQVTADAELQTGVDEVYERMLSRIRIDQPVRKSLWPRIAAAASIILAISAGSYFLLHKPNRPQQTAHRYIHDIAPGRNQATLTLANGQKIVLTKSLNGRLAQQGNMAIQVNAGTALTYSNTQTGNLPPTATYNNGNVTGYNVPIGGIYNGGTASQITNDIRGTLNYTNAWKKNFVSAITGVEERQLITQGNTWGYYGYNENSGTTQLVDDIDYLPTNPSGGYATISNLNNINPQTTDRFRSYFANAAYSYNDKYTLSASGRVDGSNYFGVAANQKNLPLWSVGGKWDIDKEFFYKVTWLPILKARVTYGFQGNLDKNLAGVTTLTYTNGAQFTNLPFAYISNYPNPNLQWEKTGMLNIGLDFGVVKDILSGSLEYFHKKGTDLIGFEPLPVSSGLSTLEGNFSDMEGNGVDIVLNSDIINRQFKWTVGLIFNYATDKITKYDGTNITPGGLPGSSGQNISPVVGKPVYGVYSYKWAGLDPANGNPRGYLNGQLSEDYGNLTAPTSLDQIIFNGPGRPVFTGGFNNRFTYKQFALAFNISYKLDYYFFKPTINYNQLFNYYSGNRDFDNRWQMPGDEKHTNVPSMIYPANPLRDQFYQESSINVDRGDNIRLQDLSLSYNLAKSVFHWLPVNNAQIYFYANNLGIIWRANHDGLDPDYPTGTPASRTYAFGLKTQF